MPAGPLRETASGGELSRVMLALMSVAAEARRRRRWCSTRSTPASAARPRARSASSCARSPTGRQVICITHLPQIASLADRHFTIVKDASGADRRAPPSRELDRGDVVGELVRMLGADETDAAARRHAKELLTCGLNAFMHPSTRVYTGVPEPDA